MKSSSLSLGTATGLFLTVALSACGGGGSDAPAPSPSASATVFTQTDAKNVAGLGLATSQLMLIQTQLEQVFIGGLLQSLSSAAASGSLSPASASCASSAGGSGSFIVSQIKAGTYVGYKINDSFDITFNACKFAGSTVSVNGKFSLVSLGNYANLSVNSVVDYRVTTTNLELNNTSLRFRSSGLQTVKFDTTTGGTGAADVTLAVGSGRSIGIFNSSTALSPGFTWTLSSGSTINAKLTNANFAFYLNGDVSSATSSGAVPLSFATTTTLTGPYSTSALYPTAGVMRVKEPSMNLLTETSYQGATATVKADTNRDGVLDLTFTTTTQALGTP
jgi:hypothetical protein